MTVRLTIDPLNPDQHSLAEALNILREGGVIAFPTETFYGLGADACRASALEKIFRLKGRTFRNPISVIVESERAVSPLVEEIPPEAQILLGKFWPGPLTVVLRASPSVLPLLTGGTGTIGIRVSSNPVARLLAQGLAGPLTATSANRSGGPECTGPEEVIRTFGDLLDAVIDGGRTPGGLGSTILDATVTPPRILREGAIPGERIREALGYQPTI